MPRELRTELESLIAGGHCNWHTTIDIVLTQGDQLHFSSGEIFVDRFGVTRQYVARLDKIQPLEMGLTEEVDSIDFTTENADTIFGKTLTGVDRQLDGARAIRGVLFIDKDLNFADNLHIYDPTLPGELLSSEINESSVAFSLVSDVDSVIVAGRTIASEFQWREPISPALLVDPRDLGGGIGLGGDGGEGGDNFGPKKFRYGDLDTLLETGLVS